MVDPTVSAGLIRQRHVIVLSIQFYKVTVNDYDSNAGGVITHHHALSFANVGGHALAVDGFDNGGSPSNNNTTLEYTLPEGKTEVYNMTFHTGFTTSVASLTNGDELGLLTEYYALSMN